MSVHSVGSGTEAENSVENEYVKMTRIVDIDKELCTGCGRCKEICPVGAITGELHSAHSIDENVCVLCGQCVQICCGYDSVLEDFATSREQRLAQRGMLSSVKEPLFAAHYRGDVEKLLVALDDDSVHTLVQCAPAVRVALGEEFGCDYGSLTPGKLASCLKHLGFNKVYDTIFAADLTIMEEGAELLARLKSTDSLPMFTSCCPGWVNYAEMNYPDLLSHLSTCKSPQQMAGALFKSYGADIEQVEAKKIFSVAIMPCTCKKHEAQREDMASNGLQDVDLVLTTRELAQLVKHKNIDFMSLEESSFDKALGEYTGAGTIFGNTGGVMEAALRSTLELATATPIENLELAGLRGGEGVRMVEVEHCGVRLKVGVVAGIQHVAPLLDDLRKGIADYHFVEVMCCPRGCVSGGGQPKTVLPEQAEKALKARRQSLYSHDASLPVRKSHENPRIMDLYTNYLGEPLGELSHKLLHIHHQGGQHE